MLCEPMDVKYVVVGAFSNRRLDLLVEGLGRIHENSRIQWKRISTDDLGYTHTHTLTHTHTNKHTKNHVYNVPLYMSIDIILV